MEFYIQIGIVLLLFSATIALLYFIYFMYKIQKSVENIEKESIRLSEKAVPALNSLQQTMDNVNSLVEELYYLTNKVKNDSSRLFDKSISIIDHVNEIANNIKKISSIVHIENLVDTIVNLKESVFSSIHETKNKSLKAFSKGIQVFWDKLNN